MSEPVSIVMASYNRAHQLGVTLDSIFVQGYPLLEVIVVDDGSTDDTRTICRARPLVHYRYLNRPGYSNPGRALNLGIRSASHDLLILQGAEVEHRGRVIEPLVQRVLENPSNWVFARVQAADGSDYCSPSNPRPLSFLSALRREHLVSIRGFDEDFDRPGYEDNDLANRLLHGLGLAPVWLGDVIGFHQEHDRPDVTADYHEMAQLLTRKGGAPIVRNQDREWGAP